MGQRGSAVFGESTTVTAERAVAFGLDGGVNEHSDPGVLKIFGDLAVTGSIVVGGSVGGGGGGASVLNDLTDVSVSSPAAGEILMYDGTNWVNSAFSGLSYPLTDPTIAAPTTWVNQGGASATTSGSRIFLRAPANSGNSVRARVKTAPSTPYTITIGGFFSVLQGASAQQAGLVFRDSASGKMVSFHVGGTTIAGTTNGLAIFSWTNATTFSATVAGSFYVSPLGGVIFLRIADNGTNRLYSYSLDGTNFVQLYSEGRTTFLTADQVGYFANDSDNRMDVGVTLLSWVEA